MDKGRKLEREKDTKEKTRIKIYVNREKKVKR